MPQLAFERVAITAFLAPGGFGPLHVWRLEAQAVFELCARRPAFDPACEIEALLLGGCDSGTHPGREALEDHCRLAMSHPEPATALQSASASGRRAQALVGARGKALDLELGFLDVLLLVPGRDAALPRAARANPAAALRQGFAALWGLSPVFCGAVPEEAWDDYAQRARAIAILMERSEVCASSEPARPPPGGEAGSEASGTRRL